MGVQVNSANSSNESKFDKAKQLLEEVRSYQSKRFEMGQEERSEQEVEDSDGDWLEKWGEVDEEAGEPSSPLDHCEAGNKT